MWRSSEPIQNFADAALLLNSSFGLAFLRCFVVPSAAMMIPQLLSYAFRASLAELISKFFPGGNLLSIICAVLSLLVTSPTCHR
ncbi:hypothetical protein HBH98_212210 [Parastagonospora nodorum]|nr:hypothetical protein HBH53_189400 [Parastagonospora nodorum]KAH3962357.1 hypothetical protein HBH51_176390 [Parastagonospora nodorum]KAH3967153.1 hypothetical protein HBH52_191480 [Parastagonospora nodorum]KAH4059874.1 hypothetical protein HBH49_025250 [Parastagonospora nodorum]KAH4062154.1 hypothetical protein HBH50_210270 [Parastagonospora nodorum]